MAGNISSVQISNSNKCPHGLPLGTCPICNGMMGGSGKTNATQPNKTKDEWSWMKCYIEGQILKGQEARKEANQNIVEKQIGLSMQIERGVNNFVLNMQNILSNIQKSLPSNIQPTFSKIVENVLTPLINIINKIPQTIEKLEKFISDIKMQIISVIEKLTALLGEIKNFVKDKIYKSFKRIKKKILKLFIWTNEEENPEIDEELEIFKGKELKKIKYAVEILNKKGKDDDSNN